MTDKKKQPAKQAPTNEPSAARLGIDEPAIKSGLDTIAIELRKARENQKLSLSELNRTTGISRSVLYGYEIGRTKPGAKEIKLLSEALRVSPNRLIFGVDEPSLQAPPIRKLIKANPSIVMLITTMYFPVVAAVLDDDQLSAIITTVASMLESRDKTLYKSLMIFIEVLIEEVGDKLDDPELSEQLMHDPQFLPSLNKKVRERLQAQ